MDWDPRATATDGYVCPPCPVFHPTWDEFQHPLKYISSIRHIGMQAGICKIVPPAGWQPPFAINEKTFRFRTRVQQLNCIDGHTRAESNFVETLRMFLYRNGTPMQELPRVGDGGELLNLLELFKTVADLGGFTAVCEANQWDQVVRRVGRSAASDRPSPALCLQYQKHYESCLLAYERREEKQFQTPDVGKKNGKKASSTTSSSTPSEKARSSMKKKEPADTDAIMEDGSGDTLVSPSSKRVKRTLFSDAGHTSSEESDAFVAADGAVGTKRKTRGTVKPVREEDDAEDNSDEDDFDMDDDDEEEYDDDERSKKTKPPRKSAAELEPRVLKPDPKRRVRLDPPEVFTGQRFYHFIPDHGAKLGEVQRVVRGKKPHVYVKYDDGTRDTVDLSTMQLVIANGWNAEAAEVAFKSELCQTCLRGDCWDQLLLCDSCNGGHHLFCLDEPLKDVPSGDWYCDQCVQESLEPARENNPKFGFEMGSEYTLSSYKEKADNWKREYFGLKTDDEAEKISDKDLEREYWRILGTPLHEQRLEVEYGSDIDSGSVGSGFPRPDDYLKSMKVLSRRLRILSERKGASPTQRKLCEVFSRGIDEALVDGNPAGLEELLKKYAMDGWNLNNLPKFPGSVLQHLDEDIKGVMVPWVYMGMCFSTFCWHVEDHNFYSISYLHRGAPKTWYGVPCNKAEYFESVMKKLTPELFGGQPDLHLQLVTMFSPKTLIEHGVPVYRATHGPNEFIVTFPSAYHGGFNNGFNCAEAVNFATVDWLSWGAKSVRNYRNFSKLPVFAHDALVISLAETVLESHSFDYETTKTHVVPAVEQLVNDSNAFEDTLAANHVVRRESMADYARRHGMNESDTNVAAIAAAAGLGSHSRSCKMAAKPSATDSPEKADEKGSMKHRGTGKPQPSTKMMLTARPTRMVLWAGNSGKTDGLRCTTCKQYCYLQAVVCTRCRHHSSVGCMEHYPSMCKCDAEEFYVYLHRYERRHLSEVMEGIGRRLLPVEDWLMDYRATFEKPGSAKPPVSLAKKLLSVGLQCGGVPQEKLDELEGMIEEAVKWTEATEKSMKGSSASDALPDLARMIAQAERLGVVPEGIERVESFLGEWVTCKNDAARLVDEVRTIQHAESLSSAFDFQSDTQDTEALWSENERHLDTIRQLVDVSERAESIGQPLPQPLATRVHEAKQYVRVLIAANEMLAVIARFTKAKAANQQPSPTGSASTAVTPPPKPADVAVIMESDCRHVIMQADVLERDLQLSIFKIKILRSLLRVTEADSEDLNYALDDYSKSFEELDSLWRRLRALPICPDRLDELGKRLTLCKSWEHRAKKLVDAVTRSASAAATARQGISLDEVLTRPDLAEAERFYDEADRHFVPVSSFVRRQLHSRIQDCRRWFATMHGLFVRPPLTPASPSLPQFLRTAIENVRTMHGNASVAAASQLFCICDQVLCEHASYVGCSRCQLLFHTQCVSHPVGVSTPFVCTGCRELPPAPRSYLHTKRQIPSPPYPMFCMCRGPEDSSMICCDVCDEWYHSACIGMTAEEMNQAEAYRCARCAIKQNLYYLDKKALRRGALGRRPAVSRIESMLVQLQTTLIALPPGTHELLQYLRHVKDVETRARLYVADFASDFSVASFTSLDYHAEHQKLLSLMREVTNLEVHLESAIGNLSAIHWSLRACELVLGCEHAPKYSHLVILLDDAKQPHFVFPRPEYHHIQQTIEDRVARATQWLKIAKTLEEEQWNTDKARQLVFQYHELARFLELPASEVELVFRVAGERIPSPPQNVIAGHVYEQRHPHNSNGHHHQFVV